ncbi:MAG: acyltransferase [Flavobacteriales bacterium]|nr:acyltransferase [Flavobacteriales bacterium]
MASKIHFPNLNGLRFIAALLVIIHHIEQYKACFDIPSYYKSIPFVGIIGNLGVILFFVLSGFLITYLLLVEKEKVKTIKIKHFYLRRILRIWPLYMLTLLISLLILPQFDLYKETFNLSIELPNTFPLYIIMLPNIVLSIYGFIPFASHTWSIGTEEQFYLLWPLIVKRFQTNYLLVLFILIIIIHMIIRGTLWTLDSNSEESLIISLNIFWETFSIHTMAIGGIFAILYKQKSILLKILLNKWFFLCITMIASIAILKGQWVSYIHKELYASMFGIIILNLAVNKNYKNILEFKLLNELGKISYGLYMFHPVAIFITIYFAKQINSYSNWLIYPICIMISICFSYFSYHYFERFFIKLKSRFTVVKSSS